MWRILTIKNNENGQREILNNNTHFKEAAFKYWFYLSQINIMDYEAPSVCWNGKDFALTSLHVHYSQFVLNVYTHVFGRSAGEKITRSEMQRRIETVALGVDEFTERLTSMCNFYNLTYAVGVRDETPVDPAMDTITVYFTYHMLSDPDPLLTKGQLMEILEGEQCMETFYYFRDSVHLLAQEEIPFSWSPLSKLNKDRNRIVPDPLSPFGALYLEDQVPPDSIYDFAFHTYYPVIAKSNPGYGTFASLNSGRNPHRNDDVYKIPPEVPDPLDPPVEFEKYKIFCSQGAYDACDFGVFEKHLEPVVSAMRNAYSKQAEMDPEYREERSETEWLEFYQVTS